jgi:acyl-CoA reductase-like NAD-dependent aldehyde dehydrogenase
LSEKEATKVIQSAYQTHRTWRHVPLEERIKTFNKAMEYFETNAEQIAKDVTGQMGKPIGQSRGEIKTMLARVKKMIELAPEGLGEKLIKQDDKGILKITRDPVGVVFMISPWNYPLLTTINCLVASVLAGNSVVIKASPHTPLVAKHFEEAFKHAGTSHLVSDMMVTAESCQQLYPLPEIGFVSFTGSVQGGRSVQDDLGAIRFIDTCFELGGKDPAYVAPDANLDAAVDGLMDGAMYNSGQSCCAIERIYVHESLYDKFVEKSTAFLKNTYKIGDPNDPSTNLGPMTLEEAPDKLAKQVELAVTDGAKVAIGGMKTQDDKGKGRFFEPTLLYDCENTMDIMLSESFGPIVGVAKVKNEEDAIKLMNDSNYGLTAAIYTENKDLALKMAPRLHAGTVFMNRCDSCDPSLPWSGRKDSGKGIGLSYLGYHSVTKTKGYNFKF